MSETVQAKFSVNGKEVEIQTPGDRALLEVLREELGLTGTKFGCGEGACGACSVLVNGKRTFSCSTTVADVVGKSVTTIEGLAKGDALHPVQEAFLAEGAMQCGYCVPGMIMGAVALLERKANPTEAEITEWMNGHLCRCCGYVKVVAAVHRAMQVAEVKP